MSYQPQCIFVYGTLQPGGTYWPDYCDGKVADVRPAKVRGQLFDLHVGYPGARFIGRSWIYGCVMTVLYEEAFCAIDALEGYDANREYSENEYTRVRIDCYEGDNSRLGEVWAYEVNTHLLTRFQGSLIPDGVWPL